jgi:hypothetical protein
VSLSIDGGIEIGASLAHATIDDVEVTADAITFAGALHFPNKNRQKLRGALIAFYERDSFGGDDRIALELREHANTYGVGGTLYWVEDVVADVRLVPAVSVTYVMPEAIQFDRLRSSRRGDDDNFTMYGFEFAVGLFNGNSSVLTISPGVSVHDDDTTWRFTLSYIFIVKG